MLAARADVRDDYCLRDRPSGQTTLGALEHALGSCDTLVPPLGGGGGDGGGGGGSPAGPSSATGQAAATTGAGTTATGAARCWRVSSA